jgi:hypothetical protein
VHPSSCSALLLLETHDAIKLCVFNFLANILDTRLDLIAIVRCSSTDGQTDSDVQQQDAFLNVVGQSMMQNDPSITCNIFGGKESCKELSADSKFASSCTSYRPDLKVDCAYYSASEEHLDMHPGDALIKFLGDAYTNVSQHCPQCVSSLQAMVRFGLLKAAICCYCGFLLLLLDCLEQNSVLFISDDPSDLCSGVCKHFRSVGASRHTCTKPSFPLSSQPRRQRMQGSHSLLLSQRQCLVWLLP